MFLFYFSTLWIQIGFWEKPRYFIFFCGETLHLQVFYSVLDSVILHGAEEDMDVAVQVRNLTLRILTYKLETELFIKLQERLNRSALEIISRIHD